MFSPGDRVVCISKPNARGQVTSTRWVPVYTLPDVGRVYTVYSCHVHPFEGIEGIMLEELPCEAPSGRRWVIEAHHFRKVEDIEEPKRIKEKAPVPKELEPA